MKTSKQQLTVHPSNPESGFTLIESLVAIVVLSVLLIATSPIIAFSVGSRAQARRLELGSIAARSYIDALRAAAGCTTANANTSCPLDPPKIQSKGVNTKPEDFAAPNSTGNLSCENGKYCDAAKTLFCIDGDGGPRTDTSPKETKAQCSTDSLSDMVVQAVAYNDQSTDPADGYKLLVRVYRADAFSKSGTLEKKGQQSLITSAIGNPKVPVAQLSTEIAPSGLQFSDYCQRLNGQACLDN